MVMSPPLPEGGMVNQKIESHITPAPLTPALIKSFLKIGLAVPSPKLLKLQNSKLALYNEYEVQTKSLFDFPR